MSDERRSEEWPPPPPSSASGETRITLPSAYLDMEPQPPPDGAHAGILPAAPTPRATELPASTDAPGDAVLFAPPEPPLPGPVHRHWREPARVAVIDAPDPGPPVSLRLDRGTLERNNRFAARNRAYLASARIVAVNLIGSPGSGKTTLLERTIEDLGEELPIAVVTADQESSCDAERLRALGARVIQINTGVDSHLDAPGLAGALPDLDPPPGSLLLIENVGNLTCSGLFDLGEKAKVVLLSVTEGEDKPLKYGHAFRESKLLVLSKIDLLPHVSFSVQRCLRHTREANPKMRALQISATYGNGLAAWYDWLRTGMSPSGW
jgi:hydrogenase nickel incorporation protein HypB